MIPNTKIRDMIKQYIPSSFSDLNKKLYIGVVDSNKAQYILFDEWDLHDIVLGSMAIPFVFPPVRYKDYLFMDGGVLNNFPVDLAKKIYPHNEIIGIALNKFNENQTISTAWENLRVCYDVALKSQIIKHLDLVDYLFYRDIPIPTLSLDKDKYDQAFNMWYEDSMKMFGKKKEN